MISLTLKDETGSVTAISSQPATTCGGRRIADEGDFGLPHWRESRRGRPLRAQTQTPEIGRTRTQVPAVRSPARPAGRARRSRIHLACSLCIPSALLAQTLDLIPGAVLQEDVIGLGGAVQRECTGFHNDVMRRTHVGRQAALRFGRQRAGAEGAGPPYRLRPQRYWRSYTSVFVKALPLASMPFTTRVNVLPSALTVA